ncbi:MAG: DUF362 domain-containing protein, partial [candidate division Zixibacteria bacterium]|nr:DUF362 domain-containing protein [candidate division Zixibacteria bacterium]
CVAGRSMSSSPVLCGALINILAENNIEKDNIVVWERSERELERAGYPVNREGRGPKIIANDTPGIGYHNDFSVFGTVGSLVTRVLTDRVDYHVNFPILKDHSIAGLSGGLKNFYGAVHNPNKYHDPNCNPYAADMYCLPEIKRKNKLTIMDCFRIQYNGGPSFRSKYALDSNIILMSEDPVALDTVALELLENHRKLNGLDSLKDAGRYPEYLVTAADDEHKLGVHDKKYIEKVELMV